MTLYHVVVCNDINTEIFTCEERELRDILVYFILDKYDEYDEINPVLDQRILRAYDDLPIKQVIERASSAPISRSTKTYIGAIIEGGSMVFSNI